MFWHQFSLSLYTHTTPHTTHTHTTHTHHTHTPHTPHTQTHTPHTHSHTTHTHTHTHTHSHTTHTHTTRTHTTNPPAAHPHPQTRSKLSHKQHTQCSIVLKQTVLCLLGPAVAQWLRCCATDRKDVGSIPVGVIGIFHCHKIFPIALWLWDRLRL